MTRTGFTIAATILAALAMPAAAEEIGWELIGERTVPAGADRAMIDARPIVYATHLRLCADRRAVRLDDVDVFFRNGREQTLTLGAVVPAGRCTTDIALVNVGARDVDRLLLGYRAVGEGQVRPRLFVFARATTVLR